VKYFYLTPLFLLSLRAIPTVVGRRGNLFNLFTVILVKARIYTLPHLDSSFRWNDNFYGTDCFAEFTLSVA
jgi:hypothetical protein